MQKYKEMCVGVDWKHKSQLIFRQIPVCMTCEDMWCFQGLKTSQMKEINKHHVDFDDRARSSVCVNPEDSENIKTSITLTPHCKCFILFS